MFDQLLGRSSPKEEVEDSFEAAKSAKSELNRLRLGEEETHRRQNAVNDIKLFSERDSDEPRSPRSKSKSKIKIKIKMRKKENYPENGLPTN